MINTIADMKRAFRQRIEGLELPVDCLMDGSLHSEIVIIAEAPGEHEKRQGKPLVGGSGQLVWNVLHKHRIRRTMTYVTNVIKRQVSTSSGVTSGRDERRNVGKHELDNWKAVTAWELQQLPNVRYVLVLGGVALDACRIFMDTDSMAGVTS